VGWERAGRLVAPNLARTSYAVAMVHGLHGDDERRAARVRLTIDLGIDADELAGYQRGWPPVLDGLLALDRDDPATAVRRLAADIDDPALPFRGRRTVAAVVCRPLGGGRRARPPRRGGGPRATKPARRPRQPAYQRSRRGLARTWQSTELFHDLDIRENLLVAVDHGASDPARGRSSGTASRRQEAEEALDVVRMGWAADPMPDDLSESERKLVGVARALVGNHRLICLDEPAAGLDRRESQKLGRCLRRLADDGQSILLIDHDMGLVLSICDRIVVLEFGTVIAAGPPESIRRDERVVAAYLGGSSHLPPTAVKEG
jgi:branched-chain amino acid transport system ATP-binding protein